MMLRIGAAQLVSLVPSSHAGCQMGPHPAGFRTMTPIAIGLQGLCARRAGRSATRPEPSIDAERAATSPRCRADDRNRLSWVPAHRSQRPSVQGLTTAAAVWCIAAVGRCLRAWVADAGGDCNRAPPVTLVVMKIAEMPLHRAGQFALDTDAPKHNGGALSRTARRRSSCRQHRSAPAPVGLPPSR